MSPSYVTSRSDARTIAMLRSKLAAAEECLNKYRHGIIEIREFVIDTDINDIQDVILSNTFVMDKSQEILFINVDNVYQIDDDDDDDNQDDDNQDNDNQDNDNQDNDNQDDEDYVAEDDVMPELISDDETDYDSTDDSCADSGDDSCDDSCDDSADVPGADVPGADSADVPGADSGIPDLESENIVNYIYDNIIVNDYGDYGQNYGQGAVFI